MDESCYFGGKRTIESHDVSPELLVLCGVDEMEGVDSWLLHNVFEPQTQLSSFRIELTSTMEQKFKVLYFLLL